MMQAPQLVAAAAVLTGVALYLARPTKRPANRRKNHVTWIVGLINLIGRIAKRFGFNLRFSPKKLISSSIKRNRLNDFGPNSGDFDQALELFTSQANAPNNDLSFFGRILLRQLLNRILDTRLKVQELKKKSPRVTKIALRPIFIVGLFRTGTTLLYNLMAQDPNCRAPHVWEMVNVFPPPKKETFKSDWRILRSKLEWSFFPKEFDAVHYIDPAGPEEELFLFGHHFWYFHLGMSGAGFEDYQKWIRNDVGKSSLYSYFKELLQVLSFNYPPESHWVLKSPIHLIGNNFKYLYETFPDAMFVMTHRNVATAIGSTCSLVKGLCGPFEETHDPIAIGKNTLDLMSEGVKNGIEFRESLPVASRNQFLDIQYEEFIKNPIQTVKSIYEHYGIKYTDEFEQRMKVYLENNPQGKHGRHKYSLEEYGLSVDKVNSAFEHYNTHYVKC